MCWFGADLGEDGLGRRDNRVDEAPDESNGDGVPERLGEPEHECEDGDTSATPREDGLAALAISQEPELDVMDRHGHRKCVVSDG